MSREKLLEVAALFDGVVYDFHAGPFVESADHLLRVGVNCQMLAHVVLEELGYALPKWLRSKELFEDEAFTFFIDPQRDGWRPGDILFTYKKPDGFNPKALHVSVCVTVEDGEPHFLHALKFKDRRKNAVTVWKLEDFFESRLHHHIIAAKRVR